MPRRQVMAIVVAASFLAAALSLLRFSPVPAAAPQVPASAPADPLADPAQLRAEVRGSQGLIPDQAAVMTHVAYHFSNLWFAIDRENWPLADFYLGEARNNIKWAVRAKPFRKTKAGEIDLAAISQAMDNGPLTEMKKAIAERQKAKCIQLYDEALVNCYACHKASEKPYLRPQRPVQAEVPIINFDPNATTP